jgi:hypothetical protein
MDILSLLPFQEEIELIKMKFLEVDQQRKTESKLKDEQFNEALS